MWRAGRWQRGPLRVPGTYHSGVAGLGLGILGGLTSAGSLVIATHSPFLAIAALVGGATLAGSQLVASSTFGVYADEEELVRRAPFATSLARRAYVLRVRATNLVVRLDLASGSRLDLALGPEASPEAAIQVIATAWPDLEPWGTRALFRRPPKVPRSTVASPRQRGRVRLVVSQASDGYRDDQSEVTRVIHEGKRAAWTIERVATTLRLERPEIAARALDAPLVGARAEGVYVVVLAADDDIVLACDTEADAREAARLILRNLVDVASG